MDVPTPRTRVFALLGDPVAHSLSPAMHNPAFQAEGLDAIYVALRCGADEVRGLVRGLALAGGGGNVTVPHKERALAAADDVRPAARRTGAANTFWAEAGRVVVDNTDVEGFARARAAFRPGEPPPARAVVLGAGGAARAVVTALLDEGVGEILLLNRTVARARRLADELDDGRVRVVEDAAKLRGADPALVVNATRLGMEPGDPPPVDLEGLGRVDAVMDVVYRTGDTPLVREARERGIPVADGLEMLLQQGAAAFRRWWERPAPLEAMRRGVAAVG